MKALTAALESRHPRRTEARRFGTQLRLAVLAVLALLLAACAGHAPRPQAPPPTTPDKPPPVTIVLEQAPESSPPTLWQRLRQHFAFAQCQRQPVRHWANRYTRHPGVFARQLKDALPRLRYITEILLDAGVPAEFTLLPWVESNFRALPASAGGAGGMWQIMPGTARSLGLRVDADFDGRLALDQSTRAVVRMLKRDHQMLDSWRLTDLAYIAGVYGVRQAVAEHPAAMASGNLAGLGLPQVALDHVAKLQALSCIIASPARYQVELPRPDAGTHLVRRRMAEAMPLDVAARLIGMPADTLRRTNAALLDSSVPTTTLILPLAAASRFDNRYRQLQQYGWLQWQHVRISRAPTLRSLADNRPDRTALLASVNQMPAASPLPDPGKLWLPTALASALPDSMQVEPAELPPSRYTVRSGDTLWDIARRFGLKVAQIRNWNDISGSLLHLGQTLVLRP